MRIGIIADDLTGANDSGVQLTRAGLTTAVRFHMQNSDTKSVEEALVIDTDSRSIAPEEAYKQVKEAAQTLRDKQVEIVYKKLDSTLRGNIGCEIDAMYDVYQPDFVIIAPAYPKNGRVVKNGDLLLHSTPLAETEMAKDPKSPVISSSVKKIVQNQTNRDIGEINVEVLRKGYDSVRKELEKFKKADISYVIFDSEVEEDLFAIADCIKRLAYSVVWVGSAGLANHLPRTFELTKKSQLEPRDLATDPVLLVAGSVSSVTRNQLTRFLERKDVASVELPSHLLIDPSAYKEELNKAELRIATLYEQGKNIAIFSSGSRADIEKAQAAGKELGMTETDVSNKIVEQMGRLVHTIVKTQKYAGIIMTGGDTAKKICNEMNVSGIRLIDEVEVGVPLGKFIGGHDLHVVTKAGAFGSEDTFSKALTALKGEPS
ncbi:four-carbon acid sugar kinase family protein [Paenalkalicoccus suaedae]|uniref:Four-carbon acid sugar kinase family protein n=1 Tax=Paenalkalicoccus suaedae TaxID=2592382 RepID=A0A859FIE7_9BACI|nr:four-carbon acid sugar kinase family protein [Paenalkalicoccus suaedae]QKS72628.1 four-carbon acid sugar kinase family protein [Paenalkalicoccus suaedae]